MRAIQKHLDSLLGLIETLFEWTDYLLKRNNPPFQWLLLKLIKKSQIGLLCGVKLTFKRRRYKRQSQQFLTQRSSPFHTNTFFHVLPFRLSGSLEATFNDV